MVIKIIGSFLVIGILFSYVPVFPMNECPEGNHSGIMKMDCGSLFHCPMIVDVITSETSSLPLNGLLTSIMMYMLMDELARPIFHPPKYRSENFDPEGMGEKRQLSG